MACLDRLVFLLLFCAATPSNGGTPAPGAVGANGNATVDDFDTDAAGRRLIVEYSACTAPCPSGTRCDMMGSCVRDLCGDGCLNNGECLLVGYYYRCFCETPYAGARCEYEQLDPCASRPCQNDGKCNAVSNGATPFTCTCRAGYEGDSCEFRSQGPCAGRNPCRNSCECIPSCRHASGYYCRSVDGYLGKNCSVPPPVVLCLPNRVVVSVDDSFVREYDMDIGNSRLFLASRDDNALRVSQNCLATTDGITHNFSIPLPFTKCGIFADTSSGKTVVAGNIWLNRITHAAYDMPVPVVGFQCTYGREYLIVTSMKPAIDQPVTIRHEVNDRLKGVIELCKVSTTCPRNCPAEFGVTRGAIYTIGEIIHLNIRPLHRLQHVVAMKSLHLSCGADARDTVVVPLVQDGCPAGAMPTQVSRSGLDSSICASFEVPRLAGCTAFYIHADMEICSKTGCHYNARLCVSGVRNRREAAEMEVITNVKGPIYFINGSFGEGSNVLFPNRSVVDVPFVIDDLIPEDSDGNPGTTRWALLIVGICLLLVVLGTTLLAALRSRKSEFPKK